MLKEKNKLYCHNMNHIDYSREEMLKTINKHYPEIYNAYLLTRATCIMYDLEFDRRLCGVDYPSISLSLNNNNKLTVLIDFSYGCSFFVKPMANNNLSVFFNSLGIDDKFDYPDQINLDELEKWMLLIVHDNLLYEESLENE